MLDRLAESHPKLVEELVPKILSLGEVQKVLQQLLREQVSIRDLPAILETLLDVAPSSKNPIVLVESVDSHWAVRWYARCSQRWEAFVWSPSTMRSKRS